MRSRSAGSRDREFPRFLPVSYLTEHINRFGIYATDELTIKPAAFDPELAEIDFETLAQAA